LTPDQAAAICGVIAQVNNNGLDSEGFHFPNPGNALYPAQPGNQWSNQGKVLPTGKMSPTVMNPSGPEVGEVTVVAEQRSLGRYRWPLISKIAWPT
jgi:hypothetical protein